MKQANAVSSNTDAVLERPCSPLLPLVHLAVTGRVFQLKAPALILVCKPRATELNQFPPGLDVLLF